METGYPSLRGVDVTVLVAVVFLRGRLPSYHMKQLAQAVIKDVPGVGEVRNELSVACLR